MNGQVDIIFLIGLTLKLSILLVEFSLGLRTGFEDILHLFRHPALFVRSLAAMYLVVPFFALSAALAFPLNGPVKIALVALALSPVPPLLPKKQLKAGGGRSYIASLLFTAALISIVFVPVVLSLLTSVFSVGLEISPLALARFVFLMILAPGDVDQETGSHIFCKTGGTSRQNFSADLDSRRLTGALRCLAADTIPYRQWFYLSLHRLHPRRPGRRTLARRAC